MRFWVRFGIGIFGMKYLGIGIGIYQKVKEKKKIYILFFRSRFTEAQYYVKWCTVPDIWLRSWHGADLSPKNFFKFKFVYSRLQFGMSLQVALGFRTRSIWIGISRSCDVTSHSYCVHMAIVLIGLWISVLECWWTKHWLDIYYWQLICRTQFMSIIY